MSLLSFERGSGGFPVQFYATIPAVGDLLRRVFLPEVFLSQRIRYGPPSRKVRWDGRNSHNGQTPQGRSPGPTSPLRDSVSAAPRCRRLSLGRTAGNRD